MAQEQRFVVGATPDLGALEDEMRGLGASVEQTWPADEAQVVLVRAPERHAPALADRLGPNAQVLHDASEARRVAESAAVAPHGAPGEPPPGHTG